MNVIIWNCWGALKLTFQIHVRELIQIHNLAILVLLETKVGGERVREITDQLPFDGVIHMDTIGYASELWILWNSNRVEINLLSNTEQEIHVVVKVLNSNSNWLISTIYASPRRAERRILWNNLNKVVELHDMPWVLTGDFNETLTAEDKFEGRAIVVSSSLLFMECLDNCNMIDIGFTGPRFTWTNKREVHALIQERLDRFFVNPSWCLPYPDARVMHLTRCHLDHYPVMLDMLPRTSTKRARPFKFQTCWLTDPIFPNNVT